MYHLQEQLNNFFQTVGESKKMVLILSREPTQRSLTFKYENDNSGGKHHPKSGHNR